MTDTNTNTTDNDTDTKITKLEEQVKELLDKVTQLENQLIGLQESFNDFITKFDNHIHCSGPYEYTGTPTEERFHAVCWTP